MPLFELALDETFNTGSTGVDENPGHSGLVDRYLDPYDYRNYDLYYGIPTCCRDQRLGPGFGPDIGPDFGPDRSGDDSNLPGRVLSFDSSNKSVVLLLL